MKKLLYSMAVAATVMLVAACGNKEAKNNDSDSAAPAATEVAEAQEPKEEKADTIKGPTTLDLAKFSVKVPEGWYVRISSNNRCVLDPLVRPDVEGKGNFGWQVEINVNKGSYYTEDKKLETYLKFHDEAKKMSPVTIDGMKFQYYFHDYKFGKSSLLVHGLKDDAGRIDIEVGGYSVDDAPVQEILNSFKLKE